MRHYDDDSLLWLMEIVENQTGEIPSIKELGKLAADLIDFYHAVLDVSLIPEGSD